VSDLTEALDYLEGLHDDAGQPPTREQRVVYAAAREHQNCGGTLIWWCETHDCPDGQCGVIGWHHVRPFDERGYRTVVLAVPFICQLVIAYRFCGCVLEEGGSGG
jgi:hypothetical protein